jgi:hypothetical protein
MPSAAACLVPPKKYSRHSYEIEKTVIIGHRASLVIRTSAIPFGSGWHVLSENGSASRKRCTSVWRIRRAP